MRARNGSHAQQGQIGARPRAMLSGDASKLNTNESRPLHQDQLQSGRSQGASASKPSANTATGHSAQKHKDKRAQLRLWNEEGKKASLKGYKDLKPDEVCVKCGKRHRGECRMCSCGGWHKEANCRGKKGAKTGETGHQPNAAKPQQEVGEELPMMDRIALLIVLSRIIHTEQGAATFADLMNAGDRPGYHSGRQQQQQGTKPGEEPQYLDQFDELQQLSHNIRTDEDVARFVKLVNACDCPSHSPLEQEPQDYADTSMAGWEEW